MDSLQLFILSLVQGITEFLPISSSAHLILVSKFTGWPDQGIAFDVAVHCGTLCAVIFHYRSVLFNSSQTDKQLFSNVRIPGLMLAGSIPLFATAYLFESIITTTLRDTTVIAVSTISFALLLWYADHRHKDTRQSLNWSSIWFIGCAQALALIPGTSRAGITLTAGLLLGLSCTRATHISFLLAIPAIAGSSLYTMLNAARIPDFDMWPTLMLGFAIAAVFALLTIRLFLKFVEIIGLLPFIIYRLLLGVGLLFMWY